MPICLLKPSENVIFTAGRASFRASSSSPISCRHSWSLRRACSAAALLGSTFIIASSMTEQPVVQSVSFSCLLMLSYTGYFAGCFVRFHSIFCKAEGEGRG